MKLFAILLALVLVLCSVSAVADITAKVDVGVVVVTATKNCRIVVSCGKESHYYDVSAGEILLPLTFGKGKYTVTEYFQVSGRKYEKGKSVSFSYKGDTNAAYLQPNFIVNYNENSLAAKTAEELCKAAATDKEKAQILYKYLCKELTYDYAQAIYATNENVGRYSVDVDAVLQKKSGVCYDISALFVAMCRSQGITARLEVGNGHAWAVVVLDGKEAIVDIASKLQTGNAKASGFKYEPEEMF